MLISGFDWDDGNTEKCEKHEISREEIESVFYGSPAVAINTRHDLKEERFQAIGVTRDGRYAFIVFTLRQNPDGGNEPLIRPISARYMGKKEIDKYEKQTKR